MRSRIILSDPVRQALKNGVGVVALESTILTHGLPKPINFQVEVQTFKAVFFGRLNCVAVFQANDKRVEMSRKMNNRVSNWDVFFDFDQSSEVFLNFRKNRSSFTFCIKS